MDNRAVKVYQDIFSTVHDRMNGTTADLTAESAMWAPPGNCVPAGGHFAHHVLGEDFFINTLIQGKDLLAATEYAGKTGFDKPYPTDWQWGEWARTITIDLDQLRTFAAAVFANTDAYLLSLTDADLDREIDLSAMGWGVKSVSGHDRHRWRRAHRRNLRNQGNAGVKGYPF